MDRAAARQFAFQVLQLGKESVMEGLPELFWRQGLAARPTQFSPQFYYLSSPLTLSIDPTTLASPIPPLHPTRKYESLARVRR